MRLISIVFAAVVAAASAAEEIPFVPGQGSAGKLTIEERDIAKLAIEALAADLKIGKDQILVDTIKEVDWRDSSIGCPQPGQAYLQVITPGHKITLRANGAIYVVHESENGAFVCHKTKAVATITPQRELVFGQQMIDARADLAKRLHVDASEIKAVSGEERTWNDGALGCPEPGMMYTAAQVTGWVLTLRHGARDYTYHTDLQRTIPCPSISVE